MRDPATVPPMPGRAWEGTTIWKDLFRRSAMRSSTTDMKDPPAGPRSGTGMGSSEISKLAFRSGADDMTSVVSGSDAGSVSDVQWGRDGASGDATETAPTPAAP